MPRQFGDDIPTLSRQFGDEIPRLPRQFGDIPRLPGQSGDDIPRLPSQFGDEIQNGLGTLEIFSDCLGNLGIPRLPRQFGDIPRLPGQSGDDIPRLPSQFGDKIQNGLGTLEIFSDCLGNLGIPRLPRQSADCLDSHIAWNIYEYKGRHYTILSSECFV